MTLAAIVATDLNNGIGKDNKLLCHLPNDLKFFKKTTMGCPIIMGRKTYDSIGRALPGRRNIVLTRNPDFKAAGVEIFHDMEECLKSLNEEKVFVIGGAVIFNELMPFINEMYVTLIHHQFEADTFFPTIDLDHFKMVWDEHHYKDEKHHYDYTFQKYIKK